MPPTKAMSVPERSRAKMSESDEVRVKRGSTLMIFAPFLSFACITHLKDMGWFSAAFEPMMRMQSELPMSIQWFVIAPRPKVVAKLATVELCHILAWCSRYTSPSARASLE